MERRLTSNPHVVVIGGPNGAGKSTAAPLVLRGTLHVQEFVNADVIARGLSAFRPEQVAIEAGKIMLRRLRDLAAARADFAFETTLASRSFAPWLKSLIGDGYQFYLLYFWLPGPELAQARVQERVRAGGHDVPPETIHRRYYGGIANFFELYRPLASSWRMYNNSERRKPKLIASGGLGRAERIYRAQEWETIIEQSEVR